MSNVINKVTGQYIEGVHTPAYTWIRNKDGDLIDYTLRKDKSKKKIVGAVSDPENWIVNPSQADIDKYMKLPIPTDPDITIKENYINDKQRELAIQALKDDGVLDSNGDLK